MATRYYYSKTNTTYKISKITRENFTGDPHELQWGLVQGSYNEQYNDGGGWYNFRYTPSSYLSVGKTVKEFAFDAYGDTTIPSNLSNYYFSLDPEWNSNYLSFIDPIIINRYDYYTIPAGNYIYLPPLDTFEVAESIYGWETSGYYRQIGGSLINAILPSTSRTYNTIQNELSQIEVGKSPLYDDDGYLIENEPVYANNNCLIYYAVTDVVVQGYYDQIDNDYEGQIDYVSGTLQFVKADITSTGNTYYTVKTTGDYDGYYDGGYPKGSYTLEPSSVSLTTTTPQAGKTVTVSVYRTASTGANASTYGFPITYKYQYTIDGGAVWTDITSSTATSCSFIIPTNAINIIVRVIPSDKLGTGSPVASTTYIVQKPASNYAGVSGVVKNVSPIVCVGGSIKTNVTVKKGVNGTVK